MIETTFEITERLAIEWCEKNVEGKNIQLLDDNNLEIKVQHLTDICLVHDELQYRFVTPNGKYYRTTHFKILD